MSTPEGWYADPGRPGVPGAQRWWNGVSWTAHTRDQQPAPRPAAPTPTTPGTTRGTKPALEQVTDALFEMWDSLTRNPVPRHRLTADGEPLAPLAVRGLAWAVDLVVLAVLGVALRAVVVVATALVPALAGQDAVGAALDGARPWIDGAAAYLLVLGYHALQLRTRGATIGKRAWGLAVRRTDDAGRLPWGVVGRRVLVSTAYSTAPLVVLLPWFGVLAGALWLVALADKVTALGTVRQQTLHDLWAGTQVVRRGPAPILGRVRTR